MSKVAVVIPYYQRESGVLGRALDSVAAQTYRDIEVIVVDDSSPLPPDGEIDNRPEEERKRISVIRQANGGPGRARNTGLDAVPEDASYVAFLDSDDRWEPEHIAIAVAGLGAGFDLFFADYTWPRGTTTRLAQAGLLDGAVPVEAGGDIVALDRDFFECVLSCWPVHLSATVVDRRTLAHVRFDERLRFSSEDMYYLLECAGISNRVCYSRWLGVRLDDGINIFRQPVGSFEFSRSRLANAYFHRLIEPAVTARGQTTADINRRLLRTNYKDFVKSEAKSLLKGGGLNYRLYGDFLRILRGTPKAAPA